MVLNLNILGRSPNLSREERLQLCKTYGFDWLHGYVTNPSAFFYKMENTLGDIRKKYPELEHINRISTLPYSMLRHMDFVLIRNRVIGAVR